jgi:class 3 adenylate cyclase/tetratricopeptide (TPR) repeat protein
MQCPRCQQENPPQAKFCLECATRLALRCSNCGTPLPAGAKFCFECATPVSSPGSLPRPASPEAYTPKHLAELIINSKAALEGERKQVTVLFADLKGSMELLVDRDPEEARKILDPVLELMIEAVHRYEGTVNQVMGDGIMALFGAPIAHEDHGVRACYAALRMQDSVKKYAESVRRAEGVAVRIRVGLNSGEVVVRAIGSDLHMDYTAVGQTTHLAARMEQLAAPDTIAMTSATVGLAEGFVDARSLGPTPVKGLDKPVDVFELLGARAVRSRLQAMAARGLTKFVGRSAEMAQLDQALEFVRTGKGRVVSLVGEPGVGKSRVVWEFTHSHRTSGCTIVEAPAVSYGQATAYLPLVELLKVYFAIHSRDDTRRIREKVTGKVLMLDRALESSVPALLALFDVIPADDPWSRLDPVQRRHRILDAAKRLLLRESDVQPLVVVFEDLHWIDTETHAFLNLLVESLPTARVLLVVTYRPEHQHAWGSKTYYREVRFDELQPANAEELLSGLLGDDPGLAALRRVLIERTEGNPLFIEESVQSLVETGVLAGERAAYRLLGALQSWTVPASAQAILAARIDRLVPDDKRRLQAAAVIGKDVPLTLLQAISGESDENLRAGLLRLQAAEFLYEARLFPEIEYTFKHALTHEVAYGSLLHERRRALHARVVATLEELHEDGRPEQFESLAHHAYRGEHWEKTVRYARLAGDEAAARSAHRQVIELCQQALGALAHMADTEGTRREEVEIRLAMRNAHLAIGEVEAIPANLHRALTLADELGDVRWRARITSALAHFYWIRRELPQAFPLAHRAVDLAESTGDATEVALARGVLARAHWAGGEYGAAATAFQKCLEIERSEVPRGMRALIVIPSVVSQRWLAQSLGELGSFDEAIAAGREALQTAESRNHPYSLANALTGLAIVMLRRGDFVEAASLLERATAVACEFGFREFIGPEQPFLANAYAGAGRRSDAHAILNASRQSLRTAPHYHARIGEAALAVGALPEAGQHAERALEFSRRQTARGEEAWSLYLLGAVRPGEEPDSATVAEDFYRQALALAEELGMRPLIAHCHAGLAKLHHQTGRHRASDEHFTTATAMYHDMGMIFWLKRAQSEWRYRRPDG